MFDDVNAKNALLYAMKEYDNPQCLSTAEFNEDYKRFKYVKRLCRRYTTTGHISERLMLNHLILLMNVFGVQATVRLLFLKCEDVASHQVLKTFLVYLNVLPELVCGVGGTDIQMTRIPFDPHLWNMLHAL
jgi:hypothetical protein